MWRRFRLSNVGRSLLSGTTQIDSNSKNQQEMKDHCAPQQSHTSDQSSAILTWHLFYSLTRKKCVVNDFRRRKMLLKRSKTMFWRCLNRSGKNASTIGLSACKNLSIFIIRPEIYSNPVLYRNSVQYGRCLCSLFRLKS